MFHWDLSAEQIFEVILGREPLPAELTFLGAHCRHDELIADLLSTEEFSSHKTARRRARPVTKRLLITLKYSPRARTKLSQYLNAARPLTYEDVLVGHLLDKLPKAKESLPERIMFKSLPRSGHTLMKAILQGVMREKLKYCESYAPENCCHIWPCQRPFNKDRSNTFFAQKSHDSNSADSEFLDAFYVIQHREPITRAQSNFELFVRNNKTRDSEQGYEKFLSSEIQRAANFYNKWLRPKPWFRKRFVKGSGDALAIKKGHVINYEGLVADPHSELDKLLHFLGAEPNYAVNIPSVVSSIMKNKVNPVNSPEVIRRAQDFRYADAGLHAEALCELKSLVDKPVWRFLEKNTSWAKNL